MSILLQNLVKRFGATTVVDNVSLEIEDGELFVLLGASGSGKSTLLRMIAGLLPVEEGRIWLHGKDVTDLPPQVRNVGFVFQNYSLFRHMTVADNVEFGLDIRGMPKAKRAAVRDELLELVGLAGLGQRYPRQLSGGQQQRVAVARALAFEPEVLLLDEPFGALDVKIRAQLRQVLKRIQRHLKVTTILVTHDQEEAFELADRIGVVEQGQLLEVGRPSDLYRRPHHEFVAQFVGSATMLAGRWQSGQLRIGSLTLPAPTPPEGLRPSGRVAVLFRPEDLQLVAEPSESPLPILGQGVVEELYELGTLERLQVRMQSQLGTRSLQLDYGEKGIPVQIAQLADGKRKPLAVGQTVHVAIRDFHMMARTAPQLLLSLHEAENEQYLTQVIDTLSNTIEGEPTVLLVAEQADTAQKLLEQTRHALGTRLDPSRFKVRHGNIAVEILRELSGGHYDTVLVRSKQPPTEQDELAEEVAQRSPIPVLVLKGERPVAGRLLLCTAGGEPGKLDVVFGGRLARRIGAQATLLHVSANGQETSNGNGSASIHNNLVRHLEQGVQTLHGQGVQAEFKLRHGPILDEILAEASEGNYDMVVVGSHLPTAPLPFLEKDLATQVVRLSDRPVLVVRGELW